MSFMMMGAQGTTVNAAPSMEIDNLDTSASCRHFGGRDQAGVVTPLADMDTTSELLEDYADMCAFLGSLDFVAFSAGYWAHDKWLQDDATMALPLAS